MPKQNHPGSIRKRGKSYELIVKIDGTRRSKSVRVKRKADAIEAMKVFHEEVRKEVKAGGRRLDSEMTMLDLVADFEENEMPRIGDATRLQYEGFLRRLRYYLEVKLGANPRVKDFTRSACVRFRDWRGRVRFKKDGKPKPEICSPRTLQKEVSALHRLLERAVDLEVVEANYARRVAPAKLDEREPVLLTDRELDRLEAEMRGPMRKLLIIVLADTGVRAQSEALWIRWSDIDWDAGKHGRLFIWSDPEQGHTTKSRKGRSIPLTKRLRDRLKAHEEMFASRVYHGQRSRWVFHHTRDKGTTQVAGRRVKTFHKAFKAAAERAGIKGDLHQHDLRHLRITRLVQAKHPFEKVRKFAGHSDVRVTQRYTHLVPDDLDDLVE